MSSETSSNSPTVSRENQNRATALHHANLLQEQKDISNKVLDTIIEFYDLPSSPNADPATPTATDTSALKRGLAILQQRDFDDLVTERNIADKCGYPLCPRSPKKELTTATDRILWGKKNGEDLKIVPRAELERWCSKECGDRARYLKVQLNETPAWVGGLKKDKIVLLDEVKAEKAAENLSKGVQGPSLEQPEKMHVADNIRALAQRDGLSKEDEEAIRKLQQLALERGKALRAGGSEQVSLFERESAGGKVKAPSLKGEGAGSIEGYAPKGKSKKENDNDDDDGQDILDL